MTERGEGVNEALRRKSKRFEEYHGKNCVTETKEVEKFLLSLSTISKYTEM